MYRMGMMTFLLTDENNPTKLDRFRCLQIGKIVSKSQQIFVALKFPAASSYCVKIPQKFTLNISSQVPTSNCMTKKQFCMIEL